MPNVTSSATSAPVVNLLVIGDQAREHSLAMRLATSNRVGRIFVSPGNPAMDEIDKVTLVPDMPRDALVLFCREHAVTYAVIGGPKPMGSGYTDALEQAGVRVFGARATSSVLESSKAFSKGFMHRHSVRTPTSMLARSVDEVTHIVAQHVFPAMIKSDSLLRSFQTAILVNSHEEAIAAAQVVFDAQDSLGHDRLVLVEQFIRGREVSFTIWMDDKYNWKVLPPCRDYKRLMNGDLGVNTGGMGSYAPVPWLPDAMVERILVELVQPTMAGLRKERLGYCGILYFGIMIDETTGDPHVLEYNIRLGDSECQTILQLLESDLFELLEATLDNRLGSYKPAWKAGHAMTIYLVPDGFPLENTTGIVLSWPSVGQADGSGAVLYGSSLYADGDQWKTGPGRPVCASSFADDIESAQRACIAALQHVQIDKAAFYRADIGHDIDIPLTCVALP